MLKTVGELKAALSELPDGKEIAIALSGNIFDNRKVGTVLGIDEWVEGVTIVCREATITITTNDQARDEATLIEVREERRRQIDEKSYSEAHDDNHNQGQLADAAACYAAGRPIYGLAIGERRDMIRKVAISELWPWGDGQDKRNTTRRNPGRIRELVKAIAMLVAEIGRLKRRKARRLA